MHFYLGPIIILTKKLTLAQCIFRNFRNLLRVSYFVLTSNKRVIYIKNERVTSVVRWQENHSNILIVIEAIDEPWFDHFFSFNKAFE